MSLTSGTRLGAYEIVSLLGAGAMGEVYRARDPRLDRDVAVKILPGAFATDAERVRRFEQEARAAAALNHPNILAVYDIGQHAGSPYIVAELLEGHTLRDRLRDGPLPVRDAIRVAAQIANGLAAAHERGIVHRDLKPENVFVTADARVKILDFGLAKLTEGEAALAAGASTLPTAAPDTLPGVVLGTASYMSPEQVRAQPADARSDLFALGAVLYEMVSGRRAFSAGTAADTMAAVLREEPSDLAAVHTVPPALARIVHRCLQKSPAARFQSAGDLAFALESLSTLSSGEVPTPSRASRVAPLRQAMWAIGTIAASALAAVSIWWLIRAPAAPAAVVHASIELSAAAPPLVRLERGTSTSGSIAAVLAISPQGTHVVYTGRAGDRMQLYARSLDRPEIVPLAEGGAPFFSPDGQWVGFFADGKLKRVPIVGGPAFEICDAAFGFGGAWGEDGTIVFAGRLQGALLRVPATGGEPQPFSRLAPGEGAHRWPAFIPGTRDVLFGTAAGFDWDNGGIAIQSLDAAEHRILLDGGMSPRYASTGHIVFARGGTLFAVPFDAARRATAAAARALLDGVASYNLSGTAQYALSTNGTLVYMSGGVEEPRRSLVWVDRSGRETPLQVAERGFETPRIAPDGERIAVTVREADSDIWVVEPRRGTLTRITAEAGEDHSAVWTVDGQSVTYSSSRQGQSSVRQKAADGSGSEKELFASEWHRHLGGWVDARTLLTEAAAASGNDVRIVTIGDTPSDHGYLETMWQEQEPALSPDGRWLAHTSNESGGTEVYVHSFPEPTKRVRISTAGGREPVWARDGRELYYRQGDAMLAVGVALEPTFSPTASRTLFEGPYTSVVWGEANYDVDRSGRFLMIKPVGQPAPVELHLILNWTNLLARGSAER